MKLILKNLKKDFGNKQVLKDVNFEFRSGKIYSILGRNGSGKTTLFNLIYGELEKDEGEIKIEDNKVEKEIKYEDISMVFSENFLPKFLTGYEFIKFFIEVNKNRDILPTEVENYLDMVDLNDEDRHRLIKDYSHGMQSKLSILTILILKSKVILLDEPLVNMDIIMAAQIKKILLKLSKDHIILFSTHVLALAKEISDEIVILHNKKLSTVMEKDSDYKQFEKDIVEILSDEMEITDV